ncbi:MAG: hypothetical protein WD398_01930 [Cyclobacteriaceae bacterium]
MHTLLHLQKSNRFTLSLMVISIAVLLPILLHLIPPVNGIPIGAYLLPMFYIPLIALLIFGRKIALITAALAPTLNFLLVGNNNWGWMGMLTLELLVFTFVGSILIKTKFKMLLAMIALILAKLVSAIFIGSMELLPVTPFGYFQASLINAIPGLLILILITYYILKNNQKFLPS